MIEQEICDTVPLVITKMLRGDDYIYFGMVGGAKVTHEFKSKEELLDSLKKIGINDWLQMLAIMRGHFDIILNERLKELNLIK